MRNKENSRRLKREWYLKNRALTIKRSKIWAENNKQARNESQKKYDRNHRKEALIRMRKWRRNNPERSKQENKKHYNLKTKMAWANLNRCKINKAARDWRLRNPHKVAMFSSARRALKLHRTVNPKLIAEFIKTVRSKKSIKCYYCDRKVSGKRAHIDHVKALKGKELGNHEIGNLCASCPNCNLSKSNKTISDWSKYGQQILPI